MAAPEFDIEQPGVLHSWLIGHGYIPAAELPTYTVLPGGVSNRTVLVDRSPRQSWVVKQALAKLRVQVDWFSSPERIHREAAALRSLIDLAPPDAITPLVFEDVADHIIGMEAVPVPHENWKVQLLRGDLTDDAVDQFATIAASIHAKSAEQIEALRPEFGDRTFFESLRVEPYYEYTASQVPGAFDFYADLIGDMRRRQETFTHGDYSPKNVLVHDNRLILLDHEVGHLGDPTFDLGFAMTHLLSKAHHLPAHRDQFAAATNRFWATYWQTVSTDGAPAWTADLQQRAVRQTLGCLLARVRGRSTLEYLDHTERDRQATVVVDLMAQPPENVGALTIEFCALIEREESHA